MKMKITLALICIATLCGSKEIYLKNGFVVNGKLVKRIPKQIKEGVQKSYYVIDFGEERFYKEEEIDKIIDTDIFGPNFLTGPYRASTKTRSISKEAFPPYGGRVVASQGEFEPCSNGSFNLKLYQEKPTNPCKLSDLYTETILNYTSEVSGRRLGVIEGVLEADLVPGDG